MREDQSKETLGRKIYGFLKEQDADENRAAEFEKYFRRAVVRFLLIVYVWPLFLFASEKVAGGTVWIPPLTLGVFGTTDVMIGSILLALGALTDLPEFRDFGEVEQQMYHYLGFFLIGAGSVLLLGNEWSPNALVTEGERQMVANQLSSLVAPQLFEILFVVTTFIAATAVPVLFALVLLLRLHSE